MNSLRQQLEARERDVLAPQAAKSADSRGRLRPAPEDDVRPAFQRDRDRIVHCKAFRRLKHKTQVFFAPTGDHYRTRLTHTLEVSQIARTIAKVSDDIDDATRAGILRSEDLPADLVQALGNSSSLRIGTMVKDVVTETLAGGLTEIRMSAPVLKAVLALRAFLFEAVYENTI